MYLNKNCGFVLYLGQFIIQKERKQGKGRGRERDERKTNRWLSCGYMTILQRHFIGDCLVWALWFVCWGHKDLDVRETNHSTCEPPSFRVNSTTWVYRSFPSCLKLESSRACEVHASHVSDQSYIKVPNMYVAKHLAQLQNRTPSPQLAYNLVRKLSRWIIQE